MLNINLSKFKSQYLKKKNQTLYYSINTDGFHEVENLINNFLIEKNSFVFESVEKGFIKGRYTIFGKKDWGQLLCTLPHLFGTPEYSIMGGCNLIPALHLMPAITSTTQVYLSRYIFKLKNILAE